MSVTTRTGNSAGSTKTFGYDEAHPDRLASYNGKTITYNANGGVDSYDGWNYSWSKGKLSSISKTSNARALKPNLSPTKTYSFTYNALGQRVTSSYSNFWSNDSIVSVGTGEVVNYTKQYKYDHVGRLLEEIVNSDRYGMGSYSETLRYLYDDSSIVGVQYTNGANTNAYYFLKNLQGDVIAIYDANGAKVVTYSYDAWGNCTIDSTTTDYDLAHANPIRYRGYYYDENTKLYYLNSRYYSPEFRRFISPDDTNYLVPKNVNGCNLYCYCGNDPILYIDPNGTLAYTAWYDGEGYDPTDDWWISNGAYGGGAAPMGTYIGSKFVKDMYNQDKKNLEKTANLLEKFVMWLVGAIESITIALFPKNKVKNSDLAENNDEVFKKAQTNSNNAPHHGGIDQTGIWSGEYDTPTTFPNKYMGGSGGGTLPDHTGYDIWDENGWAIE